MPLLILGLIVITCITVYWYIGSSDEGSGSRNPAEKFSDAARGRAETVKSDLAKKIRRRAGLYDADYKIEDDGYGENDEDEDDNSIPFPSDVERAKKKRNIR